MKKLSLIKHNNNIYRILDTDEDSLFIIDCVHKTMPVWIDISVLKGYRECSENELLQLTNITLQSLTELDMASQKVVNERFTMIADILPVVSNVKERKKVISKTSQENDISKQTIRNYLCSYLVYQSKSILAPNPKSAKRELTKDEKNIRWALNKFYYNKHNNSLKTVYTLMLKNKYCDANGILLPDYPSFYQFRYFYRKTMKLQNVYISRDGIKSYQRNNRPLLGDGVQTFAPTIGTGMIDATICDIYLVSDSGELIGRPILTACVDAHSGLCYGYSLSWEGGMYSIKNLLVNMITDKPSWCHQFGIDIDESDWNCDKLPAVMVTDMGTEYQSENFEQLAELGMKIVNLPAYRPELKGSIEKFFDVIQGLYKPHLKGKGLIELDYQERGAHDYRKDATLSMADFESIILHCIIYYNSNRVLENFPYTEEMLSDKVKPYSSCIWNWCMQNADTNLIDVSLNDLILTLMPRTNGTFTRHGLKVGKLHYKHENYAESFLSGGTVMVAYNPDDVSSVWLIENGCYIEFKLIESRFENKSIVEVDKLFQDKKELLSSVANENLQKRIDLAEHIEVIASHSDKRVDSIKGIRKTRKREQNKIHIDYIRMVK